MLYPKFIVNGSKIAIPAPSDGANCETDKNRYKNAIKKFKNMKYNTECSKNLFNSKMARSGDKISRAQELNELFIRDDIDLILCATGGEFLIEILPYINFDKILKSPKWVEGFSDPTGILFPLTTKYDIATIYGNNFKSFGMDEYHKSLKDNLEILKGNIIKQKSYDMYEDERLEKITGFEGYNLTQKVMWKTLNGKPVTMQGRIFAGCLDIIAELAGTQFDGTKEFIEKYKKDGIIWAFDNCDLSKEELIRTLWRLNEFGFFKYTKGIIFGRNGNDISFVGYDAKNALKDSVISELQIPIIYDADISHKGPSMTIINGAIATVVCDEGKGKIEFDLR